VSLRNEACRQPFIANVVVFYAVEQAICLLGSSRVRAVLVVANRAAQAASFDEGPYRPD